MHHINAIAGLFLAGLLTSIVTWADEPIGYVRGESLLTKYHCQACHQPYDMRQGPTLNAIADRFASDPHAIGILEAAILNGSTGAWGPIPMAPCNVPQKDLKPLVEWILSLR